MQNAIIIGAGPAGLTAAYELLSKTDIKPIIIEKEAFVGGIACTIDYNGNKMDMGGHRFFTKSNIVNEWWNDILPKQSAPAADDILLNKTPRYLSSDGADPEKTDDVMLSRTRISRIYHNNNFFDYPVKIDIQTIKKLGFIKMVKIGSSYLKSIFLKKKEKSLEDFLINRFGKELYLTFFKEYTEKLWGVKCSEISADWGAQRIKGISILEIIKDIFKKTFNIKSKHVETSLIDNFWYPKLGPGQLWKTVANKIEEMGGIINFEEDVIEINKENNKIVSLKTKDKKGNIKTYKGDLFFSTMPIKDLINITNDIPYDVQNIANGLMYRDFMVVGVLLSELSIKDYSNNKLNNLIKDTWIYIQEPYVKMGRVQIFNNWSPYLPEDFKKNIWIGLEYFCNETDDLWKMSQEAFCKFAIEEAQKIGLLQQSCVLDCCQRKVKKAYPAYFGSYKDFDIIKNYINKIDNLFLIGRNGMHRYNNMDHSVLSAIIAVNNIKENIKDKTNIWMVNTEKEYNETEHNR